MNLKRMIWRSSHVEEGLGVLWLIAGILSYQIVPIKIVTVVFFIISAACFLAAIMRAREEMKDSQKHKKYTVIKEDCDKLVMRMVENTEDHPEVIEHNGCYYRLEMCNGKDAIFKRERKEL